MRYRGFHKKKNNWGGEMIKMGVIFYKWIKGVENIDSSFFDYISNIREELKNTNRVRKNMRKKKKNFRVRTIKMEYFFLRDEKI